MALDIYSGTLGRYYTGDWQNCLQVWAGFGMQRQPQGSRGLGYVRT